MEKKMPSGRALKEKDVVTLSEMFPTLERDIIETVLIGVNGKFDDAIEKLLEITAENNTQKQTEKNDLAVIACSLLTDNDTNDLNQLESTSRPDGIDQLGIEVGQSQGLALKKEAKKLSNFDKIRLAYQELEVKSLESGNMNDLSSPSDQNATNDLNKNIKENSKQGTLPPHLVSSAANRELQVMTTPSNKKMDSMGHLTSVRTTHTLPEQRETSLNLDTNSKHLNDDAKVPGFLKEFALNDLTDTSNLTNWDNYFQSLGADPMSIPTVESFGNDLSVSGPFDVFKHFGGEKLEKPQRDTSNDPKASQKNRKKKKTHEKNIPVEINNLEDSAPIVTKSVINKSKSEQSLDQNSSEKSVSSKLSASAHSFIPSWLQSPPHANSKTQFTSTSPFGSTGSSNLTSRNTIMKLEAARQSFSDQNKHKKLQGEKKENVKPNSFSMNGPYNSHLINDLNDLSSISNGDHLLSSAQYGTSQIPKVPWRNSFIEKKSEDQPIPTPLTLKPFGIATKFKNVPNIIPRKAPKPIFPPSPSAWSYNGSDNIIPKSQHQGDNGNSAIAHQKDTNDAVHHRKHPALELACSYAKDKLPVMFIMRGLPGSGKSFLARHLLDSSKSQGSVGFVLSSDDFFQMNGTYQFNRQSLSDAHAWNQKRALKYVKEGVSPIVIDNTNTMMWELMPYATMAVNHGYDIQLVEPDTLWKYNVKELTKRNIHDVPRESIKRMKDRYEEITLDKVLQNTAKTSHIRRSNVLKPTDSKDHTSEQIKGFVYKRNSSPSKSFVPPQVVSKELDLDMQNWNTAEVLWKGSWRNTQNTPPHNEKRNAHSDHGFVRPKIPISYPISKDVWEPLDSMKSPNPEEISTTESSSQGQDEWQGAKAQRLPVQRNRHRKSSESEEKREKTDAEICQSLTSAILSIIHPSKLSVTAESDKLDEVLSSSGDISADPQRECSVTDSSGSLQSRSSVSEDNHTSDNSPEEQDIHVDALCDAVCDSAVLKGVFEGCVSEHSETNSDTDLTTVQEKESLLEDTLECVDKFNQLSLVCYSDSEDDNEEMLSEQVGIMKISSDKEKGENSIEENNETLNQMPEDASSVSDSEFKTDSERDSKEGNDNKDDDEYHSCSESGDPVKENTSNDFQESEVTTKAFENLFDTFAQELEIRSASVSVNVSRDQSPSIHSDDSVLPSSPRKKKTRVRKGRTVGPFLDESVKMQSQSLSWNQFEPQIPKAENILTENSDPERLEIKEMNSSASQCEPYYFSFVYRLNSRAFNDYAPTDLLSSEHTIFSSSSKVIDVSDVIVPRKDGTSDKSTATEMFEQDLADLETLQSCFPEYSRKQLEDTMVVCHNNIEWVTSHLLDSTSLASEESEDDEDTQPKSPTKRLKVKQIPSLASMCTEVLKSQEWVDSDDLEMQVIQAGQNRLQKIENYSLVRLLSTHSERSSGYEPPSDSFLGTVSPFECWEWTPSGEPLDSEEQTPGSPNSDNCVVEILPAPEANKIVKKAKISELSLAGKQPFSPFSSSLMRLADVTSPRPSSGGVALSPLEEYLHTNSPKSPKQLDVRHGQAVVPVEFIQILESMFGSLHRQDADQDLPLDDSLARKMYNCIKLQTTKKPVKHLQTSSQSEAQLQADEALAQSLQDEAYARSLQEKENRQAEQNPQNSVPGWTNQRPAWMNSDWAEQAKRRNEQAYLDQYRSQYTNSVSHLLHELRGTKGNKIKPSKFKQAVPVAFSNSVWHNAHKGKQPQNFLSIMEEEKEREATLQEKLTKLRASDRNLALSSKINRKQLVHMYPMMSTELLDEIFFQNDCSMETTMKALTLTYGVKPAPMSQEQDDALISSVMQRSKEEYKQAGVEDDEDYQTCWGTDESGTLSYEDLRTEAQLYRRLAKECQEKAQRYQSDGMAAAAFFYRQQVKRYKDEELSANQRAADVLFEKRHERLDKENQLDLHFYHLDEAKIAVDRAILLKEEEIIRRPSKKNSHLFVITGRGQHSKGGISKLKPGIINHLRTRGLRFEDSSAGMLKVYLGTRV